MVFSLLRCQNRKTGLGGFGTHPASSRGRLGVVCRKLVLSGRGGESGLLQVAVSGGQVRVVDVPEPALRPGGVLVRTSHSLISVGTESAGLGSGGGENLLVKAIRNPALVRKVLDRVSS